MKRTLACITILALTASMNTFAAKKEEEAKTKNYTEKPSTKMVNESQIFDRNLRLDIQLLPLENDDKGIYVVAASPEFHAAVEFG